MQSVYNNAKCHIQLLTVYWLASYTDSRQLLMKEGVVQRRSGIGRVRDEEHQQLPGKGEEDSLVSGSSEAAGRRVQGRIGLMDKGVETPERV